MSSRMRDKVSFHLNPKKKDVFNRFSKVEALAAMNELKATLLYQRVSCGAYQ